VPAYGRPMKHSMKQMWGCVAILALLAVFSLTGANAGYLLFAFLWTEQHRRRSATRFVSSEGALHCVDLVTLVLEQAGHDLLEGPSPVAEPHVARGRHGVELLVAEFGKETQGIPGG
jgi:hypothetical protein